MRKASWIALAILLVLGASWLLFHHRIKRFLRGPAEVSTGLFQDPEGLALDGDGNVVVSDEDRGVMTLLSPDGKVLLSFAEIGGIRMIHGDSLVAASRRRVVTIGEHELWILDLTGPAPKVVSSFGRRGPGDGEFEDPEGIAEDPANGDLYVTDEDHRRVQVFDRDGKFLRLFKVGDDPEGICLAPDGRVVVTFSKAHCAGIFSKEGVPGPRFGRKGSGPGEFNNPDFARFGPDGLLYVTDQKNGRISVWSSDLKPLRTLGRPGRGPGEFDDPEDLAFDREGNLWVADGGNHRIQVIRPDGAFVKEIR